MILNDNILAPEQSGLFDEQPEIPPVIVQAYQHKTEHLQLHFWKHQ